jgi:hypothetical protein
LFPLSRSPWNTGSFGGVHTVMPTIESESNFPSTLGLRTKRAVPRIILLVVVLFCSWSQDARAGCTHARPMGWYSQLRSDLPETIKATEKARWSGLFEVVYEDGKFVYVAGASDNQSRLPRCGRDSEESLGQHALHFGSSRPNLPPASNRLTPHQANCPSARFPSEISLGLLLDGHLQLPEHPPRF